MDKTGIQWTDSTWNPIRGCSRVSAGCDNCYAMGQAHRFSGTGKPYDGLTVLRRGKVDWLGKARLHPEMLDQPLRWKRPRRIFVNSMSDLFHESLSNEEIAAVFGVMAAAPQHTFQVLTKRPKRMLEWFAWLASEGVPPVQLCLRAALHVVPVFVGFHLGTPIIKKQWDAAKWPIPNVHLGVSVEDQRSAEERIPLLLKVPAAVRFISAEPLLGPVHLHERWLLGLFDHCEIDGRSASGLGSDLDDGCAGCPGHGDECAAKRGPKLDWVIVGGESGPGARPCNVEWIRDIVQQCAEASVPVFVKQLGSDPIMEPGPISWPSTHKKGAHPSEWPEELRVREFPVETGGERG